MRKSIKTTVFQTIAVFIIMCLVTACSKKNENNEEENNTSGKHTYHIEIAGGKTYSGSLPSYAPGVGTQFNPVAFINESSEGKTIGTVISDPGAFQIGVGFLLTGGNTPVYTENQAFAFNEWGAEERYRLEGPVNLSLENYKEHTITSFGEEARVASFTLHFSGSFKLGNSSEIVNATGKLVVAAP